MIQRDKLAEKQARLERIERVRGRMIADPKIKKQKTEEWRKFRDAWDKFYRATGKLDKEIQMAINNLEFAMAANRGHLDTYFGCQTQASQEYKQGFRQNES